jgi:hypothetical protein
VKIDIPIDIEPESLLRYMSRTEKRKFVVDLIASLDPDSYHHVAVFLAENPDDSVECPRCKCHTIRLKNDPKCTICKAVLP